MKQRISHGAEIDAATPDEIARIIAAAFSRAPTAQYRRAKGIVNLNASGNGQTQVADLLVPAQYDLLLERVAIGGNGAASALVCLYENQQSDTDLLEVISLGTVGKYSDSFSNRMYVTANSSVLIVVTGGVANLQVTYNLQGRLIPAN